MDDGASSPVSMFGSFSGNNLDYDLMDELLDNGYWLETTEESNFSLLEPNAHDFNPTPYQQNYGQGVERSDFDETPLLHNSQTVDFSKNQSRNREVILAKSYSDQSENIMVESTEPNKRLWIAPNPTSYVSVKSRLMRAIDCLAKLTNDSDVLIQIWVPIKREGRQFLTTDDQPFFYNEKSTSLAIYRDVSKKYSFPAEKDSKDFIGLPGRVFLKKSPEWTPDVRFFKIEEYPRVHHAHQCNVSGSLALPVFEQESGICLGVVEIITTTQTMNYRPEIENICKALEAVDLRSSEISCPPSWKGCDDSYQIVLNEIQHVLKFVCDAHDLPLAQSWALCVQQGTSECMRSNKIQALCISTIDSVCYLRDERVRPFHEACSQHCLHIGEGTVGEAFATNQPCFATDIAAFSKTDYPLSHYAKMFHLHGSVAIRLRSIYTGLADFVLEFFLPSDCEDVDEQLRILGQISSGLQLVCKSLRVLTGDEVERENIDFINETYVKKREINIEDTEGKSKNVDLSLEHKEGELEVFEENPQAVNEEIYPNFGSKRSGESGEYFFANAGKKSGEKRRAKSEKNISLEVLRQYFAGSLKDAAKSIGVCPTTLKRICRQHGITRWPSRKIKKVGHSLRKLQLVIDSVQGVEGTIQLNSFYSKFPELSTTKMPTTSSAPQLEDRFFKPFSTKLEAGVLSPNTTTSKSSGSQSSGSSFSTEEKPTLVTSPLAEQPPLRALSETELHENGQEKTKLLVRSKSDKILPMENRNFKEDGGFHVKVTFGEEKIRLFLQRNWGFGDVKNEILRRFRIDENGKVGLKYLDDDDEWVLLTCDADLEECIDIHKSTKSRTIKITVHQGPDSNLFGSFGSSS